MSIKNCRDCNYAGNDHHSGCGKCRECHGTGKIGGFDALAASLGGTSQNCPNCDGTGKCPTCEGKGWYQD